MGKAKPKPGSGFNTHLLTMDETWWVREHPFNKHVVAVKALVLEVARIEEQLDVLRDRLGVAVEQMNEYRTAADSGRTRC